LKKIIALILVIAVFVLAITSCQKNIGSKTVKSFREQIYNYLESIDAVEYSIEDSLHNACIPSPLAITFAHKYPINTDHIWKIKDISDLYNLQSGKIKLPPHHQAKIAQFGKIPETVAETLREYIKYVLKCKDKDFEELKLELSTLESAGILTEELLNEITNSSKTILNQKEKQS
jgi:hypothetical protein